jgi:hypothetical protein
MIDDTWQFDYGEWYFDPRRFSDPKGMMAKLHEMGYKVLLWMCPFVSMDSPAFRRIAFGYNPDDVNGYPVKGGFLLASKEKGVHRVPPAAAVPWWNAIVRFLISPILTQSHGLRNSLNDWLRIMVRTGLNSMAAGWSSTAVCAGILLLTTSRFRQRRRVLFMAISPLNTRVVNIAMDSGSQENPS